MNFIKMKNTEIQMFSYFREIFENFHKTIVMFFKIPNSFSFQPPSRLERHLQCSSRSDHNSVARSVQSVGESLNTTVGE